LTDSITFDAVTLANLYLLALVIWREARGTSFDAMKAVAFSVRNRVLHPSWWGKDWHSVITAHLQYSSFNAGDPNAVKYPQAEDPQWKAAVDVANTVYNGGATAAACPDPTNGSTHYYDRSLDENPPSWAKSPEMTHVSDIGPFHFYRPVFLGVKA